MYGNAVGVQYGGCSVGVEMGDVNVECVAYVFMPLENITASVAVGDRIMDITGIHRLLPK